jgi:hypothetical protein
VWIEGSRNTDDQRGLLEQWREFWLHVENDMPRGLTEEDSLIREDAAWTAAVDVYPITKEGGATRASISAGGTKKTDCISRSSAGCRRGCQSDSILASRTDELRRIRSCKALTWTDIALRESSRLGSPSKASAVRQERRGVRCRTAMAVGAKQATPRVHMTHARAKRKPDRVCPTAVDDNPSPACTFIIPSTPGASRVGVGR